jgi:HlyD family secretion protein
MTRQILLLMAVLVLSGCRQVSNDAAGLQPNYIATSVGRVDAQDEARHLVAATDGVISHVGVRRGERVLRGQRLLTIDCGPRQSLATAQAANARRAADAAVTAADGARLEEVQMARAKREGALSLVADAQDRLNRALGLQGSGFITSREIAARQNAVLAAQASADAAGAQLLMLTNGPRTSEVASAAAAASAARSEAAGALTLVRQSDLTSPIDGTVLQILRQSGEASGAGQAAALIIVGDMSRLIVRAEVNERDAAKVRLQQPADVWVEGSGPRWRGRVVEMASVMGRRTARSLDPSDRFDRDTREVMIDFNGPSPPPLVGLRVMVGLLQ